MPSSSWFSMLWKWRGWQGGLLWKLTSSDWSGNGPFTTCQTLKWVQKNSKNNLTLVSSPVFTAPSGDVLCFALCVAHKTDYLRYADWLLKYPTNQQKGYEKATQTEKQSTPPERALKTKLETRVRLFVLFCLTHFFVWQVVLGSK